MEIQTQDINSSHEFCDKFCIVIVNYFSWENTIGYLKINNLIEDKRIIIVIVDNDSPNDSFDELSSFTERYDHIKVIRSKKNGGYAYGINVGLGFVRQKYPGIKYAVVTNNDVLFGFHQFIHLLEDCYKIFIKYPSVSIYGPRIVSDEGRIQSPLIGFSPRVYLFFNLFSPLSYYIKELVLYFRSKKSHFAYTVNGSFWVFDIDKLANVGDLDETTFLFGEELMIAYKFRQAGYRVYYDAKNQITHNHSKSINVFYNYRSVAALTLESELKYADMISSHSTIFRVLLRRSLRYRIGLSLCGKKLLSFLR